MAIDNQVSFSRFSNLRTNISEHGSTVEEFKLQQGSPDANPVAAPMANPGRTENTLGLSRLGNSDMMRLKQPSSTGAANDFTGPQKNVFLVRSAIGKLRGQIVSELRELVRGGGAGPENISRLMEDSLSRVFVLTERLEERQSMTTLIYNQMAANASA